MPIPARLDFITCKNCSHTDNIHKKQDGRSHRDRPCNAYLCGCTKFVKKE